ncbi:uncharacterized protein [Oncorhynchus clarkii lewisi]|uniref:uncharacterized protein n=1 Tax=Oncorhynchus clarkii lewisi TaxID=490388 RepID=UPI0039B9BF37
MEDYEKFIQRRLYELKRKDSNDNNKNQRRTLESPCTRQGSSAIRFHGSPILPPLLTGVQREEMQRHREAAKRTMDRRKTRPSETRMSYVQNILHSVQLRQAPTLEEFFQGEPGLTAANTTNLHHSNVRQVLASQDDDVTETKDSLPGSSSPPTLTVMHDGKAGVRGPPMTLTAYGAFTTNHLTTLHNTTTVRETFLDKLVCDPLTPSLARETTTHTNQVAPQTETRARERLLYDQDKTTNAECVLEEDLGSEEATVDPLADISHQSSGYVTCENAEATRVLSRTEAGESILSGPEEGTPVGTGGVLLHSTSDTNTTKACNIISHPPVDAEDLEEGSSPCDDDLITGRPADEASVTSSWCNDVIPDYLEEALVTWPLQSSDITHPVEDRRESHPGKKCSTANIVTFPQHQASSSLSDRPEPKIVVTCPQAEASTPDLCKPDQNQNQASDLDLDRPEGPYRLSLQTLLKKSQAVLERPKPGRNQQGSEPKSQAGDVDLDPEPVAGPYRLSLQTLLKKSQEHRRRQRQLKNQAKASTCPTRTQEASTHQKMEEEMSFSDKENEEFLQSGRGVAEGRKTRDRDWRKDHLGMGVQFSGPPPLEMFPKEAWVQREEEKARSSIVERMGLEKGCREGILKELEAGNGPSHLVGLEGDTQSPPGVDIDASSAVEDIQLHLSPDIQLHLSPDIQLHLSPDIQLHLSPDVTAAPSTLLENLPHPISADASITQKSFYLVREKSSTLPRPSFLGGSRFQTVPTPQFSMSPIRCKSKGDSGGGGRGTPKRQILVNTPLNVDNEVGSVTGQENDAWDQRHLHRAPLVAGGGISQGFTAPTTPLVAGGGTTPMRRSSDQAEQIAQLELNLSSLRILISDLESTLTETPESHQTHNNSQTDNNSNLTMEPPHKYMDYHTPESQAESNLTDSEKGRGDGGQRSADKMTVVPCRVQGCDSVPPLVKEVEITVTTGYKKQDGRQQQPLAARLVTSLTQKRRVSDVFRKVPYDVIKVPSEVIKVPSEVIKVRNDVVKIPASHKTPFSVLSDASNNQHQPMEWKSYPEDPAHFQSINQSYDVDTPSGLWLQGGSGSEGSLKGHDPAGKQLTPENGGGGQGGASRAKRRLVMHTTEGNRGGGRREVMDRPHSSTPEAAVQSHSQESQQLKQLQLTHAGQVRALKEEQRRQQQQLLQSPRCLSVCYGPLVAAAVKGYLTRRLLHTERVVQLLCTIKDTQQFLQSFQPQSPGRDRRQDLVLQERVTLQLRSARYEVQDIFCLSAGDRMQIISWDRQLARDREMKRKIGETGSTRGKTSLSAATQKALERKRGVMMRKVAEGQRGTGAGVVAGQKGPLAGAERQRGTGAGVVAGQKGPLAGAEGNVVKRIRGSFRPNPQRVPKTTQSRRSR